jgi:predicted kinase
MHVMCGLVAAGQTTLAQQLAESLPAVRLSRDEGMIRLYGLPHDDSVCLDRLEPCAVTQRIPAVLSCVGQPQLRRPSLALDRFPGVGPRR